MTSRKWTTVYATICTSSRMRKLPDDGARLFFILLLLQCDSYGCLRADAHVLLATVWPLLGKTEAETTIALAACVEARLVEVFQDGERLWLEIPDWDEKAGSHIRGRGVREYGPGMPEQRRGSGRCCTGPADSRTTPAPSGTPPELVRTHPAPYGTTPPIDIDRDREVLSASPEAPRNNNSLRSKKRAPKDPGAHKEAITAWCSVYRAEVGKQYPFDGALDGKQIKRLLAKPDFSLGELRRRAAAMLKSPFWAEQGIDLKKFVSQWAALGNAGRKVEQSESPPAPSQEDLVWVLRALDDPREEIRDQAMAMLAGWGTTETEIRERGGK
jgi:hypothetical protein